MLRARSYADKWTNYIKAGSQNCYPHLLAELAHSDVDQIRIRVAENPRTPIEILEILAKDKNADVRVAVGINPSTPAHISGSLAFDEDPNVRLGLADDLNTPIELLEKLREDGNPYVSCRAVQTLEYIALQEQPKRIGRDRFFRWANIDADQPELKYA
ncbi:MAG TPA: hypothetical protein V6C86_08355 [Oculatellaceae cyanobacterium]